MKWLFGGLLLVHGLIHLMGFAKAFGYAELPQLTMAISRPLGLAWLVAALLFATSSVAVFAWPRSSWIIGGAALFVSQVVITASWSDAKFGTLANAIVLIGVVYGFASQGPTSFRAQFERDVGERLASTTAPRPLTEADIATLPPALRRYLTLNGAVGRPRVRNFYATFSGRIRSGPEAPWMSFVGEQYNFFDPPARLFTMDARMSGLPVDVFHRFVGSQATMRVKVASLYPMVDAGGPGLTRAETVTLFNDMSVFAPGALVDANVLWRELDAAQVEGTFTHAGTSVRAVLIFGPTGELIDFVSDDRGAVSADGTSITAMRWSTPLGEYRAFGPHKVSARGTGRWHPAGTEAYDYIELELLDFRVNVPQRPGSSR
jgi:hypothetical protein